MRNPNSDRTPLELVRLAADHFKTKGIESPRLDAEVLMAHVLGVSRMDVYLNFDKPLGKKEVDSYREAVRRRASREPLSYISGVREFWSLNFSVEPGVLIPRPETELLVEICLARMERAGRLLDVGVGSGAISIAILSERPEWTGVGLDISAKALKTTRANVERFSMADRMEVRESNFFSALNKDAFSLIVSNPPYIPSAVVPNLMREVSGHEPREALDGGDDGLDAIRLLARQGSLFLEKNGCLAVEFGAGQEKDVKDIFTGAGKYKDIEIFNDYSGRPRVVIAVAK